MRRVVRTLCGLTFGWAVVAVAQGRTPPASPMLSAKAAVDVVCRYEGGSRQMHAPLIRGLGERPPFMERYVVTRTEFGIENVQFGDMKKLTFVQPLKLDREGYVKAVLSPREGKERKVDVLVKRDGKALILVSPGTEAPDFRLVDCLELQFLWETR